MQKLTSYESLCLLNQAVFVKVPDMFKAKSSQDTHSVKSVRIRSSSGLHFPAFGPE